MRLDLTYGVWRVLKDSTFSTDSQDVINSARVLLHLLDEPECRAACWLDECDVTAEMVSESLALELAKPDEQDSLEAFRCFLEEEFVRIGNFTPSLAETIETVVLRCHLNVSQNHLATEHLLLALAFGRDATARFLNDQGLDAVSLYNRIMNISDDALAMEEPEPIPVDFPEPVSDFAVYRIIDAASNRAMEAIRVIEDYVRFVLEDRGMSENFKRLRHDLAATLGDIPDSIRLTFRDTLGDVGTTITGPREYQRHSITDVLKANFSRFQESLRSLEEYGKVIKTSFSQEIENIRYRSYTLQKILFRSGQAGTTLTSAKLYVLVDGGKSDEALTVLVKKIIDGGADIIQLRDKNLDDRTLLHRARLIRDLTQETGTLFVMNDRPDIARIARADGVHLGQEELPIRDVRNFVGSKILIGISTHTLEQAEEAVQAGADYIGVGPVFPSKTKTFKTFPGLEFLKEVASEITIPAFAIGGITMQNLRTVCETGICRVAVQSLVTDADDPKQAVCDLNSFLKSKV